MPDYSNGAAFVDGQLTSLSGAKISLFDWGFLHSDATYDVAHVWKGKFFRLEDHIDRFYFSMDRLRLAIPHSRDELRDILVECVKASGLRDSYVEMICTRGLPEPGSRDPRTCTNQFFAFAIPFVWILNPGQQKKGLHLTVSQRQRIPPESVDPVVKNYHWLDLVMGQFDAYDQGGDNVILVDANRNLVEGPGFNIFAVTGKSIATPARGVLEGITRKTAIEMAAELGYPLEQRNLPVDEARAADEVFITSSAGGIIPVTTIDGAAIGSGVPGPVARELQEKYWALHDDPKYAFEVDTAD